jgi:hypothetical protein
MRSVSPADRPSAADAFEQVKAIEMQLSLETLRAPVLPHPDLPDIEPTDVDSIPLLDEV